VKVAMEALLAVPLMFSLFIGPALYGAESVVSDDGREVQLEDDGSWHYKTSDRFATTAEGKRVRLKDDGSWSYTGEITAPKRALEDQVFVEAQSLAVVLTDLVIETYRSKKSESHKASRKQTQTVFHVSFSVAADAANSVAIALETTSFSVEDSDGREYPIISVAPLAATISPGDEFTVVVRADGSPHWWTTKSMSLIMHKGSLAGSERFVLTHSMSSAKKKSVQGFYLYPKAADSR